MNGGGSGTFPHPTRDLPMGIGAGKMFFPLLNFFKLSVWSVLQPAPALMHLTCLRTLSTSDVGQRCVFGTPCGDTYPNCICITRNERASNDWGKALICKMESHSVPPSSPFPFSINPTSVDAKGWEWEFHEKARCWGCNDSSVRRKRDCHSVDVLERGALSLFSLCLVWFSSHPNPSTPFSGIQPKEASHTDGGAGVIASSRNIFLFSLKQV